MDDLFRLSGAVPRHPEVEAWFARGGPTRQLIRPWFEALGACGPKVRELLHDGRPTVCVGATAFAYVDAFAAHAAVGFFQGAALADPAGLLRGSGKRMRHVRLDWGQPADTRALKALITESYLDMCRRTREGDEHRGAP